MLAALALVTAGLLALGPLSLLLPRLAHPGTAALCGIALALALAGLAARSGGTLALPVGPPGADGGGMRLALDGLAGFGLLPLFLSGAASAACAPAPPARTAPLLPVTVGCMALALLAADGFTLVLGFAGMRVASWGLVAGDGGRDGRRAARLHLGTALFGAACLLPAMGLLGAQGGDPAFAAARAAPPEGWRATAVLALALLGAGSGMGLAPLHPWLPPVLAAAPGHVAVLLSGAMPAVAACALVRVLFDLCGPATPVWWGVPLLGLGAASAVLGALRANAAPDLGGVLASGAVGGLGLVAVGLGAALAARGADLTPLAALALGGALLHLLVHGTVQTLLFLCADAVRHGAGSRALSRLGGLIHRMPATALCVLVGAASLAALPPAAGFAGLWVLLQSLLAAPRIGGLAFQFVAAAAAVAAALAASLGAAAAVRLVGAAFLGRPRTPRAAAAEEAPRRVRLVLAALAGVLLLLGLLPGAALRLVGSALEPLVRAEPEGVGPLLVAPGVDAPGYAAPGLAALLGATGLAVAWVVRARAARGERRAPAWEGGADAPPAWPPPGDPAAQYGAASLARPFLRGFGPLLGVRESADATAPARPWRRPLLRRVLRRLAAAADRVQRPTPREALAATLSALALLLALAAWAGGR